MPANITFTDGTGAATLTAIGAVGRFSNWTPDPTPIQDEAERLGSGVIDTFEFRVAQRVTFTITVPNTDMAVLNRYVLHLRRGGICTVNTTDAGTRSYADMGLVAGSVPQIVRAHAQFLDYDLTVSLEYKGASVPAGGLVCIY